MINGKWISQGDYEEFLKFRENKGRAEYEFRSVKSHENNVDCPVVEVELFGEKVEVVIDTGAPIDIIDVETFNRLSPRPKLKTCESKFFGYFSKSPLPIVGKFEAIFEHGGHSVKSQILDLDGYTEKLLCYRTAKQLGLVIVTAKVTANPINWHLRLKTEFPEAFSGKIGKIEGIKVKLEIDESLTPVRQKLRPIPFHLRDQVKNELENQVVDGIIERVNEKMGPTDWVSNLVLVPKSTDPLVIRITTDSRAVNKAVKNALSWQNHRRHYLPCQWC